MKSIKGITIEFRGNTMPLAESLKDVSKLGSQLNTELKRTNTLIKLDPKDINQVRNRQDLLNRSIDNTNDKLLRLRAGQAEAAKALQAGQISQSQYDQLGKEIASAEYMLARFGKQLDNTNKQLRNLEIEKFDRLNSKLEKVKSSLSAVARTAQIALGALTALVATGVKQADELDDISRKYGTTAEELQTQRNLYAKAAEGGEGYEQALSSINSMLRSVERGSTRYNEALSKLGLDSEAIKGKSAAQAYELIYQSLRQVTDATERAVLGNALLGEAGLNLAVIAGLTSEEIQELNANFKETGIVTSEQAALAGQLADRFDDAKQKTLILAVSLMEALAPAIEVLIDGLMAVNDFLSRLSDGQVKMIVLILFIVSIIPKLIGIVQGIIFIMGKLTVATGAQAAATGALSAAGLPLFLTLSLIAGVILILIGLFMSLSKRTKQATSDITDMTSNLKGLSGFDADINAQSNAISTSNVTRNEVIDVNVKIDFDGDTPISNNNARQIAQVIEPSIVDAVNKKLLIARSSRGGL